MKPYWQQLNELSHTYGYDSLPARMLGDAALYIQNLELALRNLLEFNGHVAINSVGDVRMQGKLVKTREVATKLLDHTA